MCEAATSQENRSHYRNCANAARDDLTRPPGTTPLFMRRRKGKRQAESRHDHQWQREPTLGSREKDGESRGCSQREQLGCCRRSFTKTFENRREEHGEPTDCQRDRDDRERADPPAWYIPVGRGPTPRKGGAQLLQEEGYRLERMKRSSLGLRGTPEIRTLAISVLQ
jgi:hypothetical protein